MLDRWVFEFIVTDYLRMWENSFFIISFHVLASNEKSLLHVMIDMHSKEAQESCNVSYNRSSTY